MEYVWHPLKIWIWGKGIYWATMLYGSDQMREFCHITRLGHPLSYNSDYEAPSNILKEITKNCSNIYKRWMILYSLPGSWITGLQRRSDQRKEGFFQSFWLCSRKVLLSFRSMRFWSPGLKMHLFWLTSDTNSGIPRVSCDDTELSQQFFLFVPQEK
jgi:hypothetical protein